MIRYLIADDLTGAADASVHFAGSRTVEILLSFPGAGAAISLPTQWGGPGWGRTEAKGRLMVLDTESRSLPADEAAAVVTLACRGLHEGVFKKVDSTLRGPVAAELEAARKALGRSTAVLAPSLPTQGRIVLGGRLLVADSDAGGVAEILGAEAVLVSVDALFGGPLPPLVVIDSISDDDLDRIAAACADRPELLPAGSAGLAAAFARREGLMPATTVPTCRRVLVAIASPHAAARAQLAVLTSEPHPGIEVLAVVAAADGAPADLARALGDDVSDRVGAGAAVLATGGDAALAVCRALGITSLRPRAEVLPGVVWSETRREGVSLATKAGGFGGPRLLLDAALKLLGVDALG